MSIEAYPTNVKNLWENNGLDAARQFVRLLGTRDREYLDKNLLNVATNSDGMRWLKRALFEALGNTNAL